LKMAVSGFVKSMFNLHVGGVAAGVGEGVADAFVAGAAAEVGLHPFAVDVVVGPGVGVEEGDGVEDLAGGAVAALEAVLGGEGLLDGMVAKSFDGDDGDAVAFDGEHHAGFDGLAVEQDGAGAAVAVFAAAFGAGESELFAEDAQEGVAGADGDAAFFAVDGEDQFGEAGDFFHASCSREERMADWSRAAR
jgi:hypothetical protein